MYNIKLDENNYYTGSYAKVGKVSGGMDIPSLPPTEDFFKIKCYKWEERTEIVLVDVPKIDSETGEIEINENGDTIYTQEEQSVTRTDWFFDNDKYQEILLESVIQKSKTKIEEVGKACKEAIYAGVDVTLSNGNTYHFSLNSDDQANIASLYAQASSGLVTHFPYHADGYICEVFSAEDMLAIGNAAMEHKIYHTTLCNAINMYIRSLATSPDTGEQIDSVTYSIDTLPEDYIQRFNEFMLSLRQ